MRSKKIKIIEPIVDEIELNSIDSLTKKYEELIEPSKITKIGKKVTELIPQNIKDLKNNINLNIADQELFINMMKLIDDGFKKIEEQAAKYSISETQIIKKINNKSNYKIDNLEEICLMRSYDISKLVNSYKSQDIAIASIEGASTGIMGFAGLPFNIVLSTFLYFRAVQSIAMFYGYNIKDDPAELIIASDVFKNAMSQDGELDGNENINIINKILIVSKAEVVKQASKKTWSEMASKGGIPLLITQMRALANNAAKKALEKAGKEGIENSIFKDLFTQIGSKLTKKSIPKITMGASAIFSAIIDGKQMKNVLDYADVFYQKRFILEKEERINKLKENKKIFAPKIIIIISIILILIFIILLFTI